MIDESGKKDTQVESPQQEAMVPRSHVDRLTGVLQKQVQDAINEVRAVQTQLAETQAHLTTLEAEKSGLEDDLALASQAKDGEEGSEEAEAKVVKRLQALRKQEAEARTTLHQAQETQKRAELQERKALARELITGFKEKSLPCPFQPEDLLKLSTLAEMRLAASKAETDALLAQLQTVSKKRGESPDEFLTPGAISSTSDEENWKRYGRNEPMSSEDKKRAHAYASRQGLI